VEEKNWTVLSPVEACTNAHAALLAYVSLICVSKMAASPRAPPAQAKAGLFHVPVVFKQIVPALSIPVLDAKGLTLPTVTLPSLDASGALAHSFSFWQPRGDPRRPRLFPKKKNPRDSSYLSASRGRSGSRK
jgi:hypothetical protein